MAPKDRAEAEMNWKTKLYNISIHTAIVGFTIYITALSFGNKVNIFSYHPPLMLAGFFICMTEAILSFSNENIFSTHLNHKQRVTLHWILQTIGAGLVAAGFAVIIASKIINDKHHFVTWHAIIGLISTIAMAFAIIGGVVAKYSFPIRKIIRPVTVKVLHSLLGTIVYILMVFSVLLGVYSGWYQRNSSVTGIVVSNVIICYVIQYVLVQPIQLIYGRMRNIYLRSNLYSEPQ